MTPSHNGKVNKLIKKKNRNLLLMLPPNPGRIPYWSSGRPNFEVDVDMRAWQA